VITSSQRPLPDNTRHSQQTNIHAPVGFEPTISAGERPQAAHMLRPWVRIPPGAWMFVCCECRVLSGRGLCDELITRLDESYWLWCVVVCDLENLKNEEAMTRVGSQRHRKKSGTFISQSRFEGWLVSRNTVNIKSYLTQLSFSATDCSSHSMKVLTSSLNWIILLLIFARVS
jgi:hypothetical protein